LTALRSSLSALLVLVWAMPAAADTDCSATRIRDALSG
jgi:hypothetical protein